MADSSVIMKPSMVSIEEKAGGFYIKDSRVPLDLVVREFENGASPESIRLAYPVLTLEQVYGAITFYLGHRSEVEASLRDTERLWTEFEASHPMPDHLREKLQQAESRATGERDS
jgi:uncharacterized protein (DUF433 family)